LKSEVNDCCIVVGCSVGVGVVRSHRILELGESLRFQKLAPPNHLDHTGYK